MRFTSNTFTICAFGHNNNKTTLKRHKRMCLALVFIAFAYQPNVFVTANHNPLAGTSIFQFLFFKALFSLIIELEMQCFVHFHDAWVKTSRFCIKNDKDETKNALSKCTACILKQSHN